MLFVIGFIGIFIAAVGLSFMLNPNMFKQTMAFFGKGKRLYLVGVLRLLIGIILLTTALQCGKPAIMVLFGILFIIGGVLIFALGLEKVKSILSWWDKKGALTMRLMGLLASLIGVLLVYAV